MALKEFTQEDKELFVELCDDLIKECFRRRWQLELMVDSKDLMTRFRARRKGKATFERLSRVKLLARALKEKLSSGKEAQAEYDALDSFLKENDDIL